MAVHSNRAGDSAYRVVILALSKTKPKLIRKTFVDLSKREKRKRRLLKQFGGEVYNLDCEGISDGGKGKTGKPCPE